MTRTPLSKFKGQGHQAALLSAALTRKAAPAVSVATYWARETILRADVSGKEPDMQGMRQVQPLCADVSFEAAATVTTATEIVTPATSS